MREFTIDKVYPWGRSLEEYRHMFGLSEADLNCRIIGCGDGPAGFNAEATRLGKRVVSFDPLYAFDAAEIRRRIDQTFPIMLNECRENSSRFVWKEFHDPETLGMSRLTAMNAFLEDYEAGRADGRYVNAGLPRLPLPDNAADLALCSHFLFLYSAEFSLEFHVAAIREMLRVAPESRIFPLLTVNGERSPHLDATIALLAGEGHPCSIETVEYEFQRGGNQQLVVRRAPAYPSR